MGGGVKPSRGFDGFGALKKLCMVLSVCVVAINVWTLRRLQRQFAADLDADLEILRSHHHLRGLSEDPEDAVDHSGKSSGRQVNKILKVLQLVERVETTLRSPHKKDRVVVLGKSFIMKRDFDIWEITFGGAGYEVKATKKDLLQKENDRDWRVMLCLDLFDGKTHCIEPSDLPELKPWQKVSRLYGLRKILWNKDKFCDTMSSALKGFEAANSTREFVFPCWLLPKDYDDLIQQAKTRFTTRSFILKPTDRGEGNGIIVMDNYHKLPHWKKEFPDIDEVVVQTYLPNPFLINGRKWDMRTYVLVTSVHPLRVYMYRDGLVRFASSKYVADAKDGGKKTAFLTNTSVNKKSGMAVDDLTWPFPQVYAYLKQIGVNPDLLWERIEQAVVQVLLSAEPAFLRQFKQLRGDFTCTICYQLLGVDVIVDDDLVPRVIEVNGEPSMQLSGEAGSHYDHTKKSMTRDLVNLVFNKESHSQQLTASLYELELEGFDIGYHALGCTPDDTICLKSDDLHYLLDMKKEEQAMGGFRRIYPNKDGNMYTDFLHHLESKLPYGTETSTYRLHKILMQLVARVQITSDNSIDDPNFRLNRAAEADEEEDP